jgi:hypothetical protein
MRLQGFGLALALGLMGAVPAMAGLIGSPVDLGASATGGVSITAVDSSGSPDGSATVNGTNEFLYCVGPNNDHCVDSGLLGSIDLSDSAVSFSFSGSTFSATGTFVLELSGFDTTITSVSYVSGALNGGTFALTSFNADSMTFTGSVTDSAFSGLSGPVITYDVGSASTPEPSSVLLSALGVLALLLLKRGQTHFPFLYISAVVSSVAINGPRRVSANGRARLG